MANDGSGLGAAARVETTEKRWPQSRLAVEGRSRGLGTAKNAALPLQSAQQALYLAAQRPADKHSYVPQLITGDVALVWVIFAVETTSKRWPQSRGT